MTTEVCMQLPIVSRDVLPGLLARARFFLYDPHRKVAYLGADSSCEAELGPVSSWVTGFYAQPFWDAMPTDVWADFSRGILTFPYQYAFRVAGDFQVHPTGWTDIRQEKEPYTDWACMFQAIQEGIAAGTVTKVVASRRVQLTGTGRLSVPVVLENLLVYNPASYVFAYQVEEKIFFGATPEVLVEKTGDKVLSYALAGTVPKPNDPRKLAEVEASFITDPKNVHEHGIVVETIEGEMRALASQVATGPMHILALRNLLHLKTDVVATDTEIPVETWIQRLHPTPAMGGKPREASLALLAEQETHDRGFYAAPLGVLLAGGDATIVVGIRSALFTGTTVYAYAGCGIVAQSDCQSEYNEIDTKLRTILEAL